MPDREQMLEDFGALADLALEKTSVVPVKLWVAFCYVPGCFWHQEHRTSGSAWRDAKRHEQEWHGVEASR